MLKDYVYYDESSSTFLRWKVQRGNCFKKDSEAGFMFNHGYKGVRILNKVYMLHRVVWELHNGAIPDGLEIDHIDGNKTNNCITNLRLATRSQNNSNVKCYKTSKTGVKGIQLVKGGKFKARLQHAGKRITVGTFSTIEEAKEKLEEKRRELHKDFARSN